MSDVPAEAWRYFVASILALAVDLVLLLFLAEWIHYLVAASIAFAFGALVSYQLAIRWVFQHRKLEKNPVFEISAYVTIGLVGLCINNLAILSAVELAQVSLVLAKALAAVATFVFNFGARKMILFRRAVP